MPEFIREAASLGAKQHLAMNDGDQGDLVRQNHQGIVLEHSFGMLLQQRQNLTVGQVLDVQRAGPLPRRQRGPGTAGRAESARHGDGAEAALSQAQRVEKKSNVYSAANAPRSGSGSAS
jgi:hypothetical protein